MNYPNVAITPDTNNGDPQSWSVYSQTSFINGETQALLPEMVGRDQLLRLENAVINEYGTISELPRMDEGLFTNAVNGIAVTRKAGGTYDVYWCSSNNIYTNNISTNAATPIDVTTGTINGCTGAYLKGMQHTVEFLGKHYAANPNPDTSKNGVLNLTDKTLTIINGKTSRKLRAYTNRLWIVNADGTIQASDNGDASTWNALNIYWLPNQEPAIDFIPVQGGVIVYGQNSVYAMYGSSYTDISFTLIETGLKLSSGAALIDNVVFIPSTRGIIKATLNSVELIPHEQETYFKSNFGILIEQAYAADVITSCVLQRLKGILFTWSTSWGGTQGFIYYYTKGSYSKINQLLPSGYPYILAMNDTYVDALIGTASGSIAKVRTTSGATGRTAYLQTRHEDAGATCKKQWRALTITTNEAVTGFSLSAYLDNADTSTIISSNVSLVKGENTFWLHLNRSTTISFLLSITGPSFTIKEMRLKYRNIGQTI